MVRAAGQEAPIARKVVVAAVHAAPVFLDVPATVKKVCTIIADAGSKHIDLLVFPEVFLQGFPYWINHYAPLDQMALTRRYHDQSIEVPGPETAAISEACRAANVAIVLGVSERARSGYSCFNSQIFIDRDGTLRGVHRKLQPTFAERTIWGQGDGSTLSVHAMASARVSGLVCWEHAMNLPRQAMLEQGAEIHAASWPGLSALASFGEVADIQIDAMMRSHAIMAQCFVVVAGSPVTQEMLDLMAAELGPVTGLTTGGGWSAVIHPYCMTLAGPHKGSEETLVTATIDLEQIADLKVLVDGAGHYSRGEVLRLAINRKPLNGMLDLSASN